MLLGLQSVGKLRQVSRTPEDQADETTFPVQVQLIPERLIARIYFHEIDVPGESVSCWSYVTDGLSAHQQKEMVFTLRREQDEQASAFPQDPLILFTTIFHLAQQGQSVDVGGVTRFGEKDFMGRHLAYITPQQLQDVQIPQPAITALLITDDEVNAVQEFGITRFIARLGQASQYYPCPPWSDRSRPGLAFARTRQETVLMRVARANAPGLRVCQERDQIKVRLAPRVGEQLNQLFDQVPVNVPLALLTELDPAANGCLIWEPDQAGPAAITRPESDGSRLCGCFILFVPEQTGDGGRLLEDGFAIMLTTSSWIAVRQALMQAEAITVPAMSDGMPISFEWLDETYYNPIDGLAYVAPAGWKTYTPQSLLPDTIPSATPLQDVRLLSSEEEFAANLPTPAFATLAKAIQEQVRIICAQSSTSFGLLIQCTLYPDKAPTFKIATREDNDQEVLQRLHKALNGMGHVHTEHSSVAFQMRFVIGQGGSQ
jgi:hypothetical protein